MNPPIGNSLREYGRGMAGGLMFFAMEVWLTGFVADPMRLLIYMTATFVLLLGYNHFAGLHQDASWDFEELCQLLEQLGFEMRISGSRHFSFASRE